eukprot:m.88472 g.88472  ORF g.88472 m.88472 type:complete len:402 (-) comp21457_c5_seq1:39-1244(-)
MLSPGTKRGGSSLSSSSSSSLLCPFPSSSLASSTPSPDPNGHQLPVLHDLDSPCEPHSPLIAGGTRDEVRSSRELERHPQPDPANACPICSKPALSPTCGVIFCSCCDKPYHRHCVSSQNRPKPNLPTWYCSSCPMVDVRHLLTPFRKGECGPLSLGGRELLKCIQAGRTPAFDEKGHILEPFGCSEFECWRGVLSASECDRLLKEVGSTPDTYPRPSALTPNTGTSRKVFCCNEEQRNLRGGRYVSCPLRVNSTSPLINFVLDDGRNLNKMAETMTPSRDPFVTSTKLLCQQLAWHYEDLESHCDRDRPDKLPTKQKPNEDGVGDRITSLTLRRAAWIFFRETANHANNFAIHVQPGDMYTMAGISRWKWQHAVMLDELPTNVEECRVSVVFRLLEEYPD